MSANFKLSRNMPVSKDPFSRAFKTLPVTSKLILRSLGGIQFMVDDSLGLISLISLQYYIRKVVLIKNNLIASFQFNKDDAGTVFVYLYQLDKRYNGSYDIW